MDSISELLDALLLNILVLLPAKDVVATMVLSKRWQFLWMMVPKLVYNDDSYKNIEYGKFSRFVDRSLALHEAPVLETLRLKLFQKSVVAGFDIWIKTAVKRCVRELFVEIDCSSRASPPAILARTFYMCCTMLVTLKLRNVILVDGDSSQVSFPSLKTLSLVSVKYPGDEFVKRLLSNCHVLEDLVVEQCEDDNVTIFSVIVPSLKSLVLRTYIDRDEACGFVINAPSLECLDIDDNSSGFCIIENDMPKILTARLEVGYSVTGKIIGSITSVKSLDLCLTNAEYFLVNCRLFLIKDLMALILFMSLMQYVYPAGIVFNRLVHLKMCTCDTEWLNILMCLLRDSPKLQSLKLDLCIDDDVDDDDELPRAGMNGARYLNVCYRVLKLSNG